MAKRPTGRGGGRPGRLGPRREHAEPAMQGLDHVAPAGQLAEEAARLGAAALEHVLEKHRPLGALFRRQAPVWRSTIGAWPDVSFLHGAARSLLRWWGWIEPLEVPSIEGALLIAVLMDSDRVPAACRHWAREAGRRLDDLVPCGDAPTWTARSEGFKRLAGRADALVDPWKLFPDVYRTLAVAPAGSGPLKTRHIELIAGLQTPASTWLRVEDEPVWGLLRGEGWKPWVHRRLRLAGRLEGGVPAEALGAMLVGGGIEAQDLGSQLVGHLAAPEAGQRWWVPMAERGGEAIHLAALMGGKGVVVASGSSEDALRGLVKRARSSPYRNVTTRVWDGKHVAGKGSSFDGVVYTPPSTAIGTWRRTPEGRWLLPPDGAVGLAGRQKSLLNAAAAGVKPGGVLVYAVPTFTKVETSDVVEAFLSTHEEFALEPFPSPIDESATTGVWTLWPMVLDSDGWFYARLRRGRG